VAAAAAASVRQRTWQQQHHWYEGLALQQACSRAACASRAAGAQQLWRETMSMTHQHRPGSSCSSDNRISNIVAAATEAAEEVGAAAAACDVRSRGGRHRLHTLCCMAGPFLRWFGLPI
jgi:hypothetical protein